MIPIAVCSPRNFSLARSNGAEKVFDRHDKECAQKIVSSCFLYPPSLTHSICDSSSPVNKTYPLTNDITQKSYTKNNLKYALDCITSVESTILCFAAIGRAGGKYVSLDPWQDHVATRKVVKCDFTVGPRVFGEGCTWPTPYGSEPDEELKEFGVDLWEVARKLVADGKLKNHPLRVLDGGFEAIMAGMELIRDKKLSGEKIIVRM